MKLGFSVNAFSNHSLIYSIEKISNTGYDGVEIVLDIPHAFLPLTQDKITQIKQTLIENNMEVTNLNSNTVFGWTKNFAKEKFEPSLSNTNEKFRKWRIEYTKQSIDLASNLNSKSISITSGLNEIKNYNLCLNFFRDSLIEISQYAEKKNILIGIEYEPGLLIDDSDKVWNLVSKDFKNIGLNLDTCHAMVNNENISSIIKKFRKKIFHTHISDCKNKIHYHLLPGEGEMDFKNFYDSLKDINYSGFLTAELYTYSKFPEDAASKAFNYLKNLIK